MRRCCFKEQLFSFKSGFNSLQTFLAFKLISVIYELAECYQRLIAPKNADCRELRVYLDILYFLSSDRTKSKFSEVYLSRPSIKRLFVLIYKILL